MSIQEYYNVRGSQEHESRIPVLPNCSVHHESSIT